MKNACTFGRAVSAALLFGLLTLILNSLSASAAGVEQYTVSGPFSSDNLSVYLLHGKGTHTGKPILTLEEALQQKKVIVHETGDVNQLAVQNLSDAVVFIQSGDIVRGGRQDRTLQHGMLIPPKSGKIPLPSFCVEQGRWTARGNEKAHEFSSSGNALSAKSLKMAAKAGYQGGVWGAVAGQQQKLAQKLGSSVKDNKSDSSLELTLEHAKVKQATNQHLNKLSKVLNNQKDVIGYAFAINGKLNSADIYASSDLFKKLWPKLLKANAVEAVSEQEKGKTYSTPTVAAVQAFVREASDREEKQKISTKSGVTTIQENDKVLSENVYWYSDSTPATTARGPAKPVPRPIVHKNILAK